MKKWQRMVSYLLVAVISSLLTVTVILLNTGAEKREASKLDVLQQLIEDRFVGDVDQTLLGDAAANAMIGSLGDRWSYYIPADQYAQYLEQKENAYVGIGITITMVDGKGLELVGVTQGGAAEQAGLLAGDLIVAVDGQDVRQMELEQIKMMIRGDADTQVQITVQRDGQEQSFAVTRQQIKTVVATGTLLEDGVGLIRIVNFNDNCSEETVAAIEALKEQGAQKLIFDVRHNPGGYAKELVAVLDYLLPEGPLFRTEDSSGEQTVENSDANCLEMPMAVLVNGDSYSAAEFFAAALSEYDAAKVVGSQTSGKGYYQATFQLPDGSAVGLSIGKYYTPNGISLAGVGITPDVAVPVDEQIAAAIKAGTLAPEEDPQIQAAIQTFYQD